jgi:deoxyribodipyrimidine photolyase
VIDDLRIHAADEPRPRADGEHVLYWMQSTFRTRDNHALIFALTQANELRLPLLVYHGLRHDYPWASDRLHTFLLETAADLYREFAELGIHIRSTVLPPTDLWDRALHVAQGRRRRSSTSAE